MNEQEQSPAGQDGADKQVREEIKEVDRNVSDLPQRNRVDSGAEADGELASILDEVSSTFCMAPNASSPTRLGTLTPRRTCAIQQRPLSSLEAITIRGPQAQSNDRAPLAIEARDHAPPVEVRSQPHSITLLGQPGRTAVFRARRMVVRR
jgi:hypothetical protein